MINQTLTPYLGQWHYCMMTSWIPDLNERTGPRYLAIVDALASDIAGGRLSTGERLPTHRDLAWRLGINVGTVSRAYAEAERRHLIGGHVGRGTYVTGPAQALPVFARPVSDFVDLGANMPPGDVPDATLAQALEDIARRPGAGAFLRYQPHNGLAEHRAAGADWIARRGFAVPSERVIVCAGAQHGLTIALMTLARAGDVILSEAFTFYGLKGIADLLGLRLEGVAMDGEGMMPDALEEACRRLAPRAICLTPAVQNPTNTVMGEARRRAIAEVAARCGVPILEDDIYGYLAPQTEPIAKLGIGRCIYLTSLSKSVAPGLRIGYLTAPEEDSGRLIDALRRTTWMATPLMAEIATGWIADGTADRLTRNRRAETAARMALAASILDVAPQGPDGASLHLWMGLPAPWRARDFARACLTEGIRATPVEAFSLVRDPPQAIRLGLGQPADRESLERGLRAIARLRTEPAPAVESEAYLPVL
jgi:DNA-binding transcriptional MocR family regulator